jgi:hypothetical protein
MQNYSSYQNFQVFKDIFDGILHAKERNSIDEILGCLSSQNHPTFGGLRIRWSSAQSPLQTKLKLDIATFEKYLELLGREITR